MQQLALNGNGNGVAASHWWEEIEDEASHSVALATPYGNVTVEFALVTPEMAKVLLATMGANRKPKNRQVQELSSAMTGGLFAFNGEPLIVDDQGQLMDGQHRCLACVRSGHAFPALIVRGIRRNAFDTIDQGGRRTAADVFTMREEKHAAAKAATLRFLLAHEREKGLWNVTGLTTTIRDLEAALPRYPALETSITLARRLNDLSGVSCALMAALHWLMAQKDKALADEFFARLGDGVGLNRDDPAYLLREMLRGLRAAKRKPTQREFCAQFTHAWNAARQNRKLRVLRGLVGDANPVIA